MPPRGPRTSTPAGQAGDDFQQIQGIGAAIDRRLHDAGILTYRDLAALTPEQIAASLAGVAGLPATRIASQDWAGQAGRLAGSAAPPLPSEPDQRYVSFHVELLLDVDDSVRRTKVHHHQSGTDEAWAGWDEGRLLALLREHIPIMAPRQPAEAAELPSSVAPAATEPEPAARSGAQLDGAFSSGDQPDGAFSSGDQPDGAFSSGTSRTGPSPPGTSRTGPFLRETGRRQPTCPWACLPPPCALTTSASPARASEAGAGLLANRPRSASPSGSAGQACQRRPTWTSPPMSQPAACSATISAGHWVPCREPSRWTNRCRSS